MHFGNQLCPNVWVNGSHFTDIPVIISEEEKKNRIKPGIFQIPDYYILIPITEANIENVPSSFLLLTTDLTENAQ